MTHIIAGRFEQQDQVQHAVERLLAAGFAKEEISTFYLNPAGQHAMYPFGGDRDKSPGAKDSDTGVAVGAVTGGVIGASVGAIGIAVAGPVGPVVGALVGAHLGSLVGGLSEMKERGEAEAGGENIVEQRKSGMVVAVGVPERVRRDSALEILTSLGADHIEDAEGTITNGDWRDFDPLSPPVFLQGDAVQALRHGA